MWEECGKGRRACRIRILVFLYAINQMKLLITGLPADVNPEAVMEGMKKFGIVTHVEIVTKGKG